ncbi:hypothetical protein R1flu_012183 [Riccia fluitans]|uniref:Mitochondrial carrier protein n=1 Tax=Riccia fluitans TaxID=41844 RepID=A0ABD1ZA79_9MARC
MRGRKLEMGSRHGTGKGPSGAMSGNSMKFARPVTPDQLVSCLLKLGYAASSLQKKVDTVLDSLRSEALQLALWNDATSLGQRNVTRVRVTGFERRLFASISQSSVCENFDTVADEKQQLRTEDIEREASHGLALNSQALAGASLMPAAVITGAQDEELEGDSLTPHVLESRAERSSKNPLEFGATGRSGWLGQVGQARALYKHISVLDRTRIGAIAGGLAGAFTYSCLHPLDTVRTKLQARGAAQLYKGPMDVVFSILKTHGIKGFYSGISAVILGSMLSSAIYFGTCELGKSVLFQMPSCPSLMVPPIASAVGNIVSSAVLVPRDVITQRMQIGAKGRSWEVFLRTINKEGVKGLYSGYSAALVRALPSSVLSFTTFEYLKAVWLKRSKKRALQPWQSVLSGAMAGALSAALTTPLDVVKTRLMTQARTGVMGNIAAGSASALEAEIRAKAAAASYKGITSTLQKIWTEEGLKGLTRGMGPRILHSACFSALGYFAFETVRLELVKRHLAQIQTSHKE